MEDPAQGEAGARSPEGGRQALEEGGREMSLSSSSNFSPSSSSNTGGLPAYEGTGGKSNKVAVGDLVQE